MTKPRRGRPDDVDSGEIDAYMTPGRALVAFTRLELAIMRAHEGFMRWAVEVNKRAVGSELSFQELALLHCLRMRGKNPTLSEMLLFLNRTDVPNLQYCLRKLETGGLIERESGGGGRRQTTYTLTDSGMELTDAYAAVRNPVLKRSCRDIRDFDEALAQAADTLERLVGVYDHATQTVLNRYILDTVSDTDDDSSESPGADAAGTGTDESDNGPEKESRAEPDGSRGNARRNGSPAPRR